MFYCLLAKALGYLPLKLCTIYAEFFIGNLQCADTAHSSSSAVTTNQGRKYLARIFNFTIRAFFHYFFFNLETEYADFHPIILLICRTPKPFFNKIFAASFFACLLENSTSPSPLQAGQIIAFITSILTYR